MRNRNFMLMYINYIFNYNVIFWSEKGPDIFIFFLVKLALIPKFNADFALKLNLSHFYI